MDMTVFGITDKGMVRPGNEDALLIDERLGLLAVADGMGGHRGGEVASNMALDVLKDYLVKLSEGSDTFMGNVDARVSKQANLLASGIRLANLAIFEAAASNPSWRGMGTTIVAVLLQEGRAGIAHVGDSRLYLLRRGQIQQITGDHSLVAEQVRQGIITAEEARNSPRKNVITRALGQWEELDIEMQDIELLDGDRLLLCSDGLNGMVSDAEIAALLEAYPSSEQSCHALVEVANSYGGKDNITAVVAAFQKEKGLLSGLKKMFQRG
ncbi:MAG: Stp1/IreP family PP2C-type Ser/Thr phosphatase [Desulfuromonadales bacterium]